MVVLYEHNFVEVRELFPWFMITLLLLLSTFFSSALVLFPKLGSPLPVLQYTYFLATPLGLGSFLAGLLEIVP